MKKFCFIVLFFISFYCTAQTKYQLSLGAGQSFLQSVNMKTGDIGLNFKQDKNLFIDVNKTINKKFRLAAGIMAKVNLASFWYELNTSIPYYTERAHVPIFEGESVEVVPYLKKYFELHSSNKIRINSFLQGGISFNINEGDAQQNRSGVRDDNDQSFTISRIFENTQKLYIPYLRLTGGFEIHKKIGKQHWLGISPFITWAGLQSENNDLTVLPDDPAYISTGKFKRNRSGYGLRIIFSK